MSLKQSIPNFVTCLNLLCGCVAIYYCFNGELIYSSWLIFAATIFDFLDGFIARLLKAFSEIGKQLDSLADMVTFGVAPGAIMYKLLTEQNEGNMLSLVALLIPVFSALRLAKFNVDTRQAFYFIGVPTPANALFISSFPLIFRFDGLSIFTAVWSNFWVLFFITILMSFLLVSEIKLMSLKFKDFKWETNKLLYLLLSTCILLIVFLGYSAIPINIFLYIVISIIYQKKL